MSDGRDGNDAAPRPAASHLDPDRPAALSPIAQAEGEGEGAEFTLTRLRRCPSMEDLRAAEGIYAEVLHRLFPRDRDLDPAMGESSRGEECRGSAHADLA